MDCVWMPHWAKGAHYALVNTILASLRAESSNSLNVCMATAATAGLGGYNQNPANDMTQGTKDAVSVMLNRFTNNTVGSPQTLSKSSDPNPSTSAARSKLDYTIEQLVQCTQLSELFKPTCKQHAGIHKNDEAENSFDASLTFSRTVSRERKANSVLEIVISERNAPTFLNLIRLVAGVLDLVAEPAAHTMLAERYPFLVRFLFCEVTYEIGPYCSELVDRLPEGETARPPNFFLGCVRMCVMLHEYITSGCSGTDHCTPMVLRMAATLPVPQFVKALTQALLGLVGSHALSAPLVNATVVAAKYFASTSAGRSETCLTCCRFSINARKTLETFRDHFSLQLMELLPHCCDDHYLAISEDLPITQGHGAQNAAVVEHFQKQGLRQCILEALGTFNIQSIFPIPMWGSWTYPTKREDCAFPQPSNSHAPDSGDAPILNLDRYNTRQQLLQELIEGQQSAEDHNGTTGHNDLQFGDTFHIRYGKSIKHRIPSSKEDLRGDPSSPKEVPNIFSSQACIVCQLRCGAAAGHQKELITSSMERDLVATTLQEHFCRLSDLPFVPLSEICRPSPIQLLHDRLWQIIISYPPLRRLYYFVPHADAVCNRPDISLSVIASDLGIGKPREFVPPALVRKVSSDSADTSPSLVSVFSTISPQQRLVMRDAVLALQLFFHSQDSVSTTESQVGPNPLVDEITSPSQRSATSSRSLSIDVDAYPSFSPLFYRPLLQVILINEPVARAIISTDPSHSDLVTAGIKLIEHLRRNRVLNQKDFGWVMARSNSHVSRLAVLIPERDAEAAADRPYMAHTIGDQIGFEITSPSAIMNGNLPINNLGSSGSTSQSAATILNKGEKKAKGVVRFQETPANALATRARLRQQQQTHRRSSITIVGPGPDQIVAKKGFWGRLTSFGKSGSPVGKGLFRSNKNKLPSPGNASPKRAKSVARPPRLVSQISDDDSIDSDDSFVTSISSILATTENRSPMGAEGLGASHMHHHADAAESLDAPPYLTQILEDWSDSSSDEGHDGTRTFYRPRLDLIRHSPLVYRPPISTFIFATAMDRSRICILNGYRTSEKQVEDFGSDMTPQPSQSHNNSRRQSITQPQHTSISTAAKLLGGLTGAAFVNPLAVLNKRTVEPDEWSEASEERDTATMHSARSDDPDQHSRGESDIDPTKYALDHGLVVSMFYYPTIADLDTCLNSMLQYLHNPSGAMPAVDTSKTLVVVVESMTQVFDAVNTALVARCVEGSPDSTHAMTENCNTRLSYFQPEVSVADHVLEHVKAARRHILATTFQSQVQLTGRETIPTTPQSAKVVPSSLYFSVTSRIHFKQASDALYHILYGKAPVITAEQLQQQVEILKLPPGSTTLPSKSSYFALPSSRTNRTSNPPALSSAVTTVLNSINNRQPVATANAGSLLMNFISKVTLGVVGGRGDGHTVSPSEKSLSFNRNASFILAPQVGGMHSNKHLISFGNKPLHFKTVTQSAAGSWPLSPHWRALLSTFQYSGPAANRSTKSLAWIVHTLKQLSALLSSPILLLDTGTVPSLVSTAAAATATMIKERQSAAKKLKLHRRHPISFPSDPLHQIIASINSAIEALSLAASQTQFGCAVAAAIVTQTGAPTSVSTTAIIQAHQDGLALRMGLQPYLLRMALEQYFKISTVLPTMEESGGSRLSRLSYVMATADSAAQFATLATSSHLPTLWLEWRLVGALAAWSDGTRSNFTPYPSFRFDALHSTTEGADIDQKKLMVDELLSFLTAIAFQITAGSTEKSTSYDDYEHKTPDSLSEVSKMPVFRPAFAPKAWEFAFRSNTSAPKLVPLTIKSRIVGLLNHIIIVTAPSNPLQTPPSQRHTMYEVQCAKFLYENRPPNLVVSNDTATPTVLEGQLLCTPALLIKELAISSRCPLADILKNPTFSPLALMAKRQHLTEGERQQPAAFASIAESADLIDAIQTEIAHRVVLLNQLSVIESCHTKGQVNATPTTTPSSRRASETSIGITNPGKARDVASTPVHCEPGLVDFNSEFYFPISLSTLSRYLTHLLSSYQEVIDSAVDRSLSRVTASHTGVSEEGEETNGSDVDKSDSDSSETIARQDDDVDEEFTPHVLNRPSTADVFGAPKAGSENAKKSSTNGEASSSFFSLKSKGKSQRKAASMEGTHEDRAFTFDLQARDSIADVMCSINGLLSSLEHRRAHQNALLAGPRTSAPLLETLRETMASDALVIKQVLVIVLQALVNAGWPKLQRETSGALGPITNIVLSIPRSQRLTIMAVAPMLPAVCRLLKLVDLCHATSTTSHYFDDNERSQPQGDGQSTSANPKQDIQNQIAVLRRQRYLYDALLDSSVSRSFRALWMLLSWADVLAFATKPAPLDPYATVAEHTMKEVLQSLSIHAPPLLHFVSHEFNAAITDATTLLEVYAHSPKNGTFVVSSELAKKQKGNKPSGGDPGASSVIVGKSTFAKLSKSAVEKRICTAVIRNIPQVLDEDRPSSRIPEETTTMYIRIIKAGQSVSEKEAELYNTSLPSSLVIEGNPKAALKKISGPEKILLKTLSDLEVIRASAGAPSVMRAMLQYANVQLRSFELTPEFGTLLLSLRARCLDLFLHATCTISPPLSRGQGGRTSVDQVAPVRCAFKELVFKSGSEMAPINVTAMEIGLILAKYFATVATDPEIIGLLLMGINTLQQGTTSTTGVLKNAGVINTGAKKFLKIISNAASSPQGMRTSVNTLKGMLGPRSGGVMTAEERSQLHHYTVFAKSWMNISQKACPEPFLESLLTFLAGQQDSQLLTIERPAGTTLALNSAVSLSGDNLMMREPCGLESLSNNLRDFSSILLRRSEGRGKCSTLLQQFVTRDATDFANHEKFLKLAANELKNSVTEQLRILSSSEAQHLLAREQDQRNTKGGSKALQKNVPYDELGVAETLRAHVKSLYFSAAALLLRSTLGLGSRRPSLTETTIIRRLVEGPVQVFTSISIHTATECWRWILSDRPSLSLLLLTHITASIQWTIEQRLGLFDGAEPDLLRYVETEVPTWDIAATAKPEGGSQSYYQQLYTSDYEHNSPHKILISFLAANFVGTNSTLAYQRNVLYLLGEMARTILSRYTCTSLKDTSFSEFMRLCLLLIQIIHNLHTACEEDVTVKSQPPLPLPVIAELRFGLYKLLLRWFAKPPTSFYHTLNPSAAVSDGYVLRALSEALQKEQSYIIKCRHNGFCDISANSFSVRDQREWASRDAAHSIQASPRVDAITLTFSIHDHAFSNSNSPGPLPSKQSKKSKKGAAKDHKDLGHRERRTEHMFNIVSLLLILLRSEHERLMVWAVPGKASTDMHRYFPPHSSGQDNDLTNASAAFRLYVSSIPPSKWAAFAAAAALEQPEVVINLVSRFPSYPAVEDVARKQVTSHPQLFQHIPAAAHYYICPASINAGTPHLANWACSNIIDTLRLLSLPFRDFTHVIQFAIKSLLSAEASHLIFYLPQLMQCLGFDSTGKIENFLRQQCKNSVEFTHQLLWSLNTERTGDGSPMAKKCEALHDVIVSDLSDEKKIFYRNEFEYILGLIDVSNVLKATEKAKRKEKLRAMLKVGVSKYQDPPRTQHLYLPTNPDQRVVSIIPSTAGAMQSAAKCPILVQFKCVNRDPSSVEAGAHDLVASPPHIRACIFKFGDDCRQDQLAIQLIQLFKRIYESVRIPFFLFPYKVVTTAPSCGVIECVPNAMSRDQIGNLVESNLGEFFIQRYGHPQSERFRQARQCFIESAASYSVASFILNIKDRHNGNIMIDEFGHIVHIDFGYLFDYSPGGDINFESSPFKLTQEMLQLMGDPNSAEGAPGASKSMGTNLRERAANLIELLPGVAAPGINAEPISALVSPESYDHFVDTTVRCFLATRLYAREICILVELMLESKLPCFKPVKTIADLATRLGLGMQEHEAADYMRARILESRNNMRTNLYDRYQHIWEGIEM